MRRAKDIISESASIVEADVLKRNPLRPTVNDGNAADTVVVTDADDDIDTLHGRINARGRAEDVRRTYVDMGRRLNNAIEISRKILPEMKILREQIETYAKDYDTVSKLKDVEKILEEFIEYDGLGVDAWDMNMKSAQKGLREPIYVGDGGYAGHTPPQRRFR